MTEANTGQDHASTPLFAANSRLVRYGLAAGALGVISTPAQAAEQPYAPDGGLPVTISVGDDPFDIDINNDDVSDFVIFRETDYGGGFGIGTYSGPFDTHKVRSQAYYDPGTYYGRWAVREEPGSVLEKYDYDNSLGLYYYGSTSPGNSSILIDAKGHSSNHLPLRAFRSRPGFIGLLLAPTAMSDLSTVRIAWLEVVVSPDGSQLKILSGAYEDDPNVYEKILPNTVTPPPSSLGALAAGAE